MEKKECLLTTYVAGEKYQAFIPLLVYSCKKAYPEYDIVLFLHETLNEEIRLCLKNANLYDQVTIMENVYNTGHALSAFQAEAMRWVLWNDIFRCYKYLYIVDIDMFYIREPIPLHVQHLMHMTTTMLPYDNLRRNLILDWRGIVRYIKNYKFRGLMMYPALIWNIKTQVSQLSGLHFVEINAVYTDAFINRLEYYRNLIISNRPIKGLKAYNSECLLYLIMEESGYDNSKLAIQTNPTDMLPFSNPERSEFRPHHGIHLGIFRPGVICMIDKVKFIREILDSDTYRYYITKYKKIYDTMEFQSFLSQMPQTVLGYIERLNDYYNIK